MITLKILRWGESPRLSGGPNVITRIFIRDRWVKVRERYDGSRGWSDPGPQAKKYRQLLEGEVHKKMDSLLDPPERTQPW